MCNVQCTYTVVHYTGYCALCSMDCTVYTDVQCTFKVIYINVYNEWYIQYRLCEIIIFIRHSSYPAA